jgi:hypothetical protein
MSKEKFVRDKPHVNIGTTLLIIFSITSAVSLGMIIYIDLMKTQDSDGDSIPDLEEGSADNSLYFEILDNTLFFRTYETGTGGHEVGHNLGLSHGGFSSHVNVELGLYDDVSTAIPLLDFKIKYDSLIEFVDGNDNGFFDPTTDIVVGKTSLNNMLRLGFGYGVDGKPAYYSSYSTIDGIFKVDFYTTQEHVLLSRQVGSLSPNELKSSITITNYTPITGGTQLALNLSLTSNQDIIFSNLDLSATTSSGNFKAGYLWYDTAIINDLETIVNTTTPSSAVPINTGQIYVNFGSVINGSYDPRLSWHIPSTPKFNIFTDIPWNYLAIGSLSLVAVSIAVMKAARKKPGRVKYQPISSSTSSAENIQMPESSSKEKTWRPIVIHSGSESSETKSEPEKRIPSTLSHRDR